MNLSSVEKQRIAFMRAIAEEISNYEKRAVLKGGTALLLGYGLDRFSEDMDFDLPEGHVDDFTEPIKKAAKTLGLPEPEVLIKKNTETTKRYMVHYGAARGREGSQSYPLKVECSMRSREIADADVTIKNGIRVYVIGKLAELKAGAFVSRERARDIYDMVFLTERYPEKLKQETWDAIKNHVSTRGIDALCDSFDDERKTDPLLQNYDGTALCLKLDDNLKRHEEHRKSQESENG
jgi:predicted nucleotidyltransferase component of viral defense system